MSVTGAARSAEARFILVKTGVKMSPMTPNAPKTPVSNFRIPSELKAKAQAKALEEGKTLTDVIVDYLKRYTRGM